MGVYSRNGIWYFRTWQGRREIRRAVGRSKRQAELALARVRADIAEGKFLDPLKGNKITYGELLERYLKEHSAVHKKPSTHKKDLSRAEQLRSRFGHVLLKDVTADWVSQWIKELSEVGRKPATVNRLLALLKHSFTLAKTWGLIRQSPLMGVKLLKEHNARLRYLTPEEYQSLLAAEPRYQNPIVTTAVMTGMRKGEILSMRKDRVNWAERVYMLMDSKNGEIRGVPLNSMMVDLLRGIIREHMRRGISSPYVFIDPWTGDRWKNIDAGFRAKVKRAKLEDFRFHDLRHTAASWMRMNGVDLQTVAEVLGHKTLAMTQRYSHLSPGHRLQAVEALGKVVAATDERVAAPKPAQKPAQ